MAFSDRAAVTALRVIARYGAKTGRVRLVTFGAPVVADAEQPFKTTSSESVQDCVAAVLNYDESLVNGTTVQSGDQRVIISPVGLATPPDENGQLIIAGVRWKIVKLSPFAPAGIDIFYDVQVRR